MKNIVEVLGVGYSDSGSDSKEFKIKEKTKIKEKHSPFWI